MGWRRNGKKLKVDGRNKWETTSPIFLLVAVAHAAWNITPLVPTLYVCFSGFRTAVASFPPASTHRPEGRKAVNNYHNKRRGMSGWRPRTEARWSRRHWHLCWLRCRNLKTNALGFSLSMADCVWSSCRRSIFKQAQQWPLLSAKYFCILLSQRTRVSRWNQVYKWVCLISGSFKEGRLGRSRPPPN